MCTETTKDSVVNRTWRRVNTRIAFDAYQLMRTEVHRQSDTGYRSVTNGEVLTQALRAYLGANGSGSRAFDAHQDIFDQPELNHE